MRATVYAVAFKEGLFLMVWNPKRDGWEMPGGGIEPGETPEQAASREYMEECGYHIHIVKTRNLGYCHVCACILLDKETDACEMRSELFSEIPKKLFFSRTEYEDVIPWARSVLYGKEG
jgi:8-oxo-dGTP diphosphatase